MIPVLQVNQGNKESISPQVDTIDVYELAQTDLEQVKGLIISGGCDQIALRRCQGKLSSWVIDGGKIIINGHPIERFVHGLPLTRKLDFHGVADVWLSPGEPHPIWEGVDRRDVLLRTGIPGHHSFEELKEIGVAGFYSHVYLVDLPPNAVVITGIGEHHLPVDVAYKLGQGEVIVHAGNDLSSFDYTGTTSADLKERITSYLSGGLE